MKYLLMLFALTISGHEDSPLHDWFMTLHANGSRVPCCDITDGKRVDDVDWQTKDGHYQVKLDGHWLTVPDDAVVDVPNKLGPAVVWPWSDGEGVHIRCFMPGSGA